MHIQNSKIGQIMKAYTQNSRVESKGNSGKSAGIYGKNDELTLSSEGQQIQKALQAIHQLPDIRDDAVSDIKQQIDSGTYEIDNKALAAKLRAAGAVRFDAE